MKSLIHYLFFGIMLLFTSCGLLAPSEAMLSIIDKRKSKNNTVVIKSNVNNFQISYTNMNYRKYKKIKVTNFTTSNGVYEYVLPKLIRPYIKFKVESPGYESTEVIVKRTFSLLSLLKIPKSSKEIRVDLKPHQ